MKKLFAIALVFVMILTMAACGSVNEKEVAVLWSGNGVVEVPNSLINAIERAMYTKSVTYTHKGANGNSDTQLAQAKEAAEAGCPLVVELVDPETAATIVEYAKAAKVPVVFLGTAVETDYELAASIVTDADSVIPVLGKQIGEYIAANSKALDRNGDGKISYIIYDNGSTEGVIEAASKALSEAKKVKYPVTLEAHAAGAQSNSSVFETTKHIMAEYTDDANNTPELIIAATDEMALEVLLGLQASGFNTADKLKTHCIPIFTVGNDAYARLFADMSTMTEEEKLAFIYNVTDVVDDGLLAGTVLEDYDSLSAKTAETLVALLKGSATVESPVLVSYTTH